VATSRMHVYVALFKHLSLLRVRCDTGDGNMAEDDDDTEEEDFLVADADEDKDGVDVVVVVVADDVDVVVVVADGVDVVVVDVVVADDVDVLVAVRGVHSTTGSLVASFSLLNKQLISTDTIIRITSAAYLNSALSTANDFW
jgi:predicted DNA binding protein